MAKKYNSRFCFSFTFFISIISVHAQNGKITGIIKDSKTQQNLISAEIAIVNTKLQSYSDTNGYYLLDKIIPGTYTLQISLIGYTTKELYNILVTSGNINTINIYLDAEEKVLDAANIKAKKKTFVKQIETPLSTQSLSAQEVKSFPGANFDIVKVAQSLPGVSGSVGFRNDLVIRGGAPNETVYYLDGMEVPNINHFATQGSGGGPVGMLNVAFIDEVTLSTSAFNAKYDNPLSGVLQFRQKTGNLERTQGNFRLGASEAALTLEGPLGKSKKWSYIVSARRSYLQTLFKLIKLPFLPNYWDYQYKLTYKPTKNDEINILGLNAIDNFDFNPPKVDPTDTSITTQNNLYILNSVARFTQYSATGGISWKHLISRGYFNLVLSSNVLRNGITKYEDNDESDEQKLRLKLKSYEWEHKLRFDLNKYIGKWKLSTGANLAFCKYDNNYFQKLYIASSNSYINIASDKSVNFVKFGLFGNASRSFFSNRFNLSGGIRTDMNTFTNNGMKPLKALSPRLSATYVLNKRFNINASMGRYSKIPSYTILGYVDSNNNLANKNVDYIISNHITTGIEYVKGALRITLEGFYKIYNNYPVSINKGISYANLGGNFGFIGNELTQTIGKGRSYGIEFCLQRKLTKNFYGILSYTFYKSEFTGPNASIYIPSAWDNRHLATFTGGYKFKNNLEIGTRFRFLGSSPYTAYDTLKSRYYYINNGEGYLDYAHFNALRFKPYFAIDIRVDKKWNFKKWALDVFLEVQNATGRNNPSQPNYTFRRDPANPKNYITVDGQSVPASTLDPLKAVPIIINATNATRTPGIGMVIEF